MIDKLKYFFRVDRELDIKEYKDEFESLRIDINLQRCKKINKFLFLLNIVLILIDLTFYKPMRSENNAYVYLYYSHIIVLILSSLWFIVLKKYGEYISGNKAKIMYIILTNIVIYWCAVMSINSLKTSGQITAYIIGILSIAISIYLSPKEIFVIYFSSLIIFSAGLLIHISDAKILYSHIINSSIVVLCGIVASNLSYYSFAKDFINKKIIMKSKMEIEMSNLKLKEYEKIRTDFFANISHELRTPLNVIYSADQMLEVTLKNNDYDKLKVNKYIKMIRQNSFRLIRLINNLIDITKIDATIFEVKPINCDIIKVVENITMSVVDYIEERGISLIFDTEVEEKVIACDPDKIERIILNLLSNAIKFTEKNGSIFVNIYLNNNNIYISVRDTGIGIEKEMKDLIFERFIQADKSSTKNKYGSGIGLSLVKSLVDLHNGNIVLNSDIGQGSEFIISLPDVMVYNDYDENCLHNLSDGQIEKINIEFSDIYQ